MLNGSLGFSSATQSSGSSNSSALTTIVIAPQVSYFIMPNLAVGGLVNFLGQSQSGSSFSQLGIGPTIAYYFGDQSTTLYPFVQGAVFYNSITSSYSGYYSSSTTIGGVGFEVDAGITPMLARNIGLTLAAFFRLSNYSQNITSSSINTFGLRVGITGFLF